MAEAILNTAPKSDNLYQLATDIQVQAHRVLSLSEAIDEALDFCAGEHRDRLGRALDYLNLLQEAAEKARAAGEQIERLQLKARPQ